MDVSKSSHNDQYVLLEFCFYVQKLILNISKTKIFQIQSIKFPSIKSHQVSYQANIASQVFNFYFFKSHGFACCYLSFLLIFLAFLKFRWCLEIDSLGPFSKKLCWQCLSGISSRYRWNIKLCVPSWRENIFILLR